MNPFAVSLIVLGVLAVGAYLMAVGDRLARRRALGAALLSPLSEGKALLLQETLEPRGADTLLFRSAPAIALACVALGALVIPLGPGLVAFDPALGVFFFMAVLSPFVVAMMNAGWSQNGKQGLFGSFRAAAHLIAYEVPLGFAAIGPVMAAESFSTVRIVEAQAGLWHGAWQPLGLAIYLAAAAIMAYRHPFDIPQAAGELEGGVLGEYTGARLLLFKIALKALFVVLMAMGAVLFLGGWHGPVLPGPVWLLLKTAALAAVVSWLGDFLPRLRHDQMLAFSWKVLLPASLVNVMLVGILALVVPGARR